MSSLVFSGTKPTDTTPAPVVDVAVHTTFEPHLIGPVSDDDSSTIIDTSDLVRGRSAESDHLGNVQPFFWSVW
jgi:hypothetical protein